jgi:hypothetical protein
MTSDTLHPAHPALRASPVSPPAGTPPLLLVVVDTEEEFDWAAPFSRDSTSVQAIRQLEAFQQVMDRFGVRPTYVIDYPVASRPEAYTVIRDLVASGRASVGAHLHPWVNPPLVEEVNRVNSFACNLGETTEAAKLTVLTDTIAENVGVRPRIYKAGRYGFGPSTVRVLQQLEYDIDVSINPLMDYSAEGGPDFETFDARPFTFGTSRRMLEVPCTHGFAGFARRAGLTLHHIAQSPLLQKVRFNGVLTRSGALNKIMLSPETSTLAEMQALTHALLADQVRTFTMTLHSPSVEPGHTPYVRTAADLRAFMNRIEAFLDFFVTTLDGRPESLTTLGDWVNG